MRFIMSALLAVSLSFSAVAALSSSEQRIADLLLSGDLKQVKVAAQRLYDMKASNPELLDIAAEILAKKYPDAYSSEVDTLAWLARALGASENDRYHGILSEVISNAQNKKLERHAEKAIDDLSDTPQGEQYAAGMYTLPAGLYERAAKSDRIGDIKALMLAGDLNSLKRAAKEIVNTRTNSQELNDIAAEILLSHYTSANRNQIDTFAWLTNAIGASGSPRYVEALREIEENANYRKLRGYAEENREKLGEAQGEQYQKGMYDKPLENYAF